MFKKHTFDLRTANVDSTADDEIVVATLVGEVTISIANVDVAGKVPTFSNVLLLTFVEIEISASGRTADRQQPRRAVRHGFHRLLVHDHRFVSRYNLTCHAGARTAW